MTQALVVSFAAVSICVDPQPYSTHWASHVLPPAVAVLLDPKYSLVVRPRGQDRGSVLDLGLAAVHNDRGTGGIVVAEDDCTHLGPPIASLRAHFY